MTAQTFCTSQVALRLELMVEVGFAPVKTAQKRICLLRHASKLASMTTLRLCLLGREQIDGTSRVHL